MAFHLSPTLTGPVAALCLSLLLAACGGGDPAGPAPATVRTSVAALAGDEITLPVIGPGLVAGPVEVVDASEMGSRSVRAVGPLASGGHAVVWAARESSDDSEPWTLQVQAFDASGRKVGPAAALDIGTDVKDPLNVSAVVFPEGHVAVGYLATRRTDPVYPGAVEASAFTAVYDLAGAPLAPARRLDTMQSDLFYPRSDRLSGPVEMAGGRDGSYLVAWRLVAGSYLGRQSTFRIQRLAADAEPLDWRIHLNRKDFSGALAPFDRLRLTMLDEGGWVASQLDSNLERGPFERITQVDVARPLHMPEPGTLAAGSWVLDLRGHGSVLLADRRGSAPGEVIAPFSMHFNRLGLEQDPSAPLPAIPDAAAALRGGDDVLAWRVPAPSPLFKAQRYTPLGVAIGDPFTVNAPGELALAGLRRGGMAAAWVDTAAGLTRVMTQRFSEPAAP